MPLFLEKISPRCKLARVTPSNDSSGYLIFSAGLGSVEGGCPRVVSTELTEGILPLGEAEAYSTKWRSRDVVWANIVGEQVYVEARWVRAPKVSAWVDEPRGAFLW